LNIQRTLALWYTVRFRYVDQAVLSSLLRVNSTFKQSVNLSGIKIISVSFISKPVSSEH
jgi:hypothetical protein